VVPGRGPGYLAEDLDREAPVPLRRLALAVCLLAPPLAAQRAPNQVILFIGDGVGVSYWTAAKFAAEDLAVSRFRVLGLVDTRSSDSYVTDSGAGATVYATGVRTFNYAIGVGPDSAALTTVLELARDRGRSTGLVATSSLTHATPASFAAHVPSRSMEFEIARQMVEARVDVLLGGGARWFDPAVRPDGADLLGRIASTHTLVRSAEELRAVDPRATRRLAGFFAENHMPRAADRSPSLPGMTRTALDILSRNPNGFFLMVEGSQPDWRGHGNEPLEAVVAEMLDFDRAIGVALDWQRQNPRALIVVVSDHETGGLAIELATDSVNLAHAAQRADSVAAALARSGALPLEDSAIRTLRATATYLRQNAVGLGGKQSLVAAYTTTNHTAQMVPLFASGPGAERFAGIQENWQIGRLLWEIVGR
jgi:alkaline phosphatase